MMELKELLDEAEPTCARVHRVCSHGWGSIVPRELLPLAHPIPDWEGEITREEFAKNRRALSLSLQEAGESYSPRRSLGVRSSSVESVEEFPSEYSRPSSTEGFSERFPSGRVSSTSIRSGRSLEDNNSQDGSELGSNPGSPGLANQSAPVLPHLDGVPSPKPINIGLMSRSAPALPGLAREGRKLEAAIQPPNPTP